jgi:hypothetical protein
MKSRYITTYLLAAGLLITAPACASTYAYGTYRDRDYRVDSQRRAYAKGYEEGNEEGRNDARHGRRFEPRRHDEFRDADDGYNRRDGNREEYRDSYRRGFLVGYEHAFRANVQNRDHDGVWPSTGRR